MPSSFFLHTLVQNPVHSTADDLSDGTVVNPKVKSLDSVARIVPTADCLPQMLTCGTVIFDISYSRDELKIAMDYLKLLKELFEKQAQDNPEYDGDAGDSKKRYLILISTVMTWAVTKPLDPIIKPLGRLVGSGMFKCIPPEDTFLIPEIDAVPKSASTPSSQFSSSSHPPTSPVLFMLLSTVLESLTPACSQSSLEDISGSTSWRVNYWERGETTDLPMLNGEEDDGASDVDDTDEKEGMQENAKQNLALLKSGRPLGEDEILGYIRQRLLCREALNKGWVLDGFPTNLTQCSVLFEKGEEQDSDAGLENDEEPFDEDVDLYSNVLKKMLPDIIVSLDATDDFVCEKAMRQPEDDFRFDEEMVLKRLSEFRAGDARDVTPLNFFDELDLHPLVVPVKEHIDYAMKGAYAAVALRMGRPCRYGKLIAQIEATERKEKKEMETLRSKEERAIIELEEKMKAEREEKMEYWSELYSLMREEEEAALAAAGEPMRNYLMNNIFPTLTSGLLEVAKLRPKDPIDFLAEYLFKLNPSGKMLEPGYNLQAEKLLGKIKILDDALKDLDIKIDPLLPRDVEFGDSSTSKKKFNEMSAL
ncbi:jg9487 [Pararge aegeria aegeria]|uniref:Jg9487 protein n=1 Tax=Pararge aegeria aegeria TaxID=348720 RepID=A0A8S4RK00_9NEOP|nr:jg9487 [Pararge aegeria aegeria]